MCLDLNNPEVRLSKDHNTCNRPEVRQCVHRAQIVATGSRTHTVCLLKSHSPLSVTTGQTLMWPPQDICLFILCLLGKEGCKNKQAKQCCHVSG